MALNPKTAVASRNLALDTEPSVPIRDLGSMPEAERGDP